MRRARRGEQRVALDGRSAVEFDYKGLDGKLRRTRLVFDPPPTMLANNVASYTVRLKPDEHMSMFCAVTCCLDSAKAAPPFFKAMRAGLGDRKDQTSNITTVETSNDIFNEILCRSAADLDMLVTMTAQGRYPYAGIPWYSTTFGRDGLITAMELLWCQPSLARGVLRRLATYQATRQDAESDAEPGKILHEMRSGEMAALREVPFSLYYGSVDATPLFVMLASLYAERTGDEETLRSLWPHIEATSPGSTDRPIRIATALSSISARPSRALPTKAGRTRKTQSFMRTDGSPRARSRSSKCKAMSMPPSVLPLARHACSAATITQKRSTRRPRRWLRRSIAPSGNLSSTPTRSRSTGRNGRAARGRPTPGMRCSPASLGRNGRRRSPAASWTTASSPAGSSITAATLGIPSSISPGKACVHPVLRNGSEGDDAPIAVERGRPCRNTTSRPSASSVKARRRARRRRAPALGRPAAGQSWGTFLRNHAPNIAAMDLFVVPTIGFDLLYGLVIVQLARRELVWINVTAHPTAEWIAQQIVEAFSWNEAPRYLIRDRDAIYGAAVRRRLRAMGIRDKPIARGSPWQNCFAERLIGTICRECVDHVIALGERHLHQVLKSYANYYNTARTHRSLDKDAPVSRPVQRIGRIVSHAMAGGLHHQYVRI